VPNPLRIAEATYCQPAAVEALRDTPPDQEVRPLLMDRRAAARLLSISERMLWSLANAGKVRRLLIGRSVRFAVEDLQAYVKKLQERA
jgi:hypothetical protein